MTRQSFDIERWPFGQEDYDPEQGEEFINGLLDRFSDSPEFERLLEQYPDLWVGNLYFLFDYIKDYARREIDEIDAGFVDGVLNRYFPRKVSEFEAIGEDVVAEFRAFFEFLAREFGLENAEECVDFLSRPGLAEEFDEKMADPSNFGMAKSVMFLAYRQGYDLTDEDALSEFMEKFNTEGWGSELFSGGVGEEASEADELVGMPLGDMEPPGREEVLEAYDDEPKKQELLKRIIDAGKELPDGLRRELVEGDEEVEALLIDIVEDEFLALEAAPGGGWVAIHAVDVLGERGGEAAIDALVDVFSDYQFDEIIYSHLVSALVNMGESALEPVLELWERARDEDTRWGCADVLSRLGVRDDRVLEVLMELFDEDIVLGACFLGYYGDPAALARLHTEFERIPVDESGMPFANQEFRELAGAIESCEGELSEEERAKLERVEELRKGGDSDWLQTYVEALEPSRETYRNVDEKPGRNEPCWCGSGKKYKRCHWRQERR